MRSRCHDGPGGAQTEDQSSRRKQNEPDSLKTLLLVEDEEIVLEVLDEFLSAAGFRVFCAGSGPEALEVWGEHKSEIALLFTDVKLAGGILGPELAAQLLRERSELKVVYTSGFCPESLHGDHFIEGVNFISKPFQLPDLLELVRRQLESVPV